MASPRLTALVGALSILLNAGGAVAQGAPEPPEHDGVLAPGERRAVPDYDGQPDPPPSAGEVALWFPRILFAPLYFVTEYVVRRPLDLLFHVLERGGLLEDLPDFFTFFPDRRAGILPTLFVEFGFQPSVGLYAFWNRFLLEGNRISLHAATWGPDWLSFTIADRFEPTEGLLFGGRFAAVRRPDAIFGGIGWDATRLPRARFALDEIDGSLGLGVRTWRRSAVDFEVGYRSASFASNAFDGDPGVAERGPLPTGFEDGYSALRIGAHAALDSREVRELSTGGVVLSGHLAHHAAFGGLPMTRWLRWGGALLLATDVLGPGRVLSIGGQVSFVSPIQEGGEDPVPFTELIDLGGDTGPMRGFRPGLVRGYSIAAVSLGYVWPIWVLLDASLRVTVGNAFGRHLEDFAFERLRLAVDLGIRPRPAGEHLLELLVGLGTETFGAGPSIVSVRLAVGARSNL